MDILHTFGGICYLEKEGVYPVERDTLMIIEALERVIEGSKTLIDMGCGTGLVTLYASSKGLSTISVDRESLALIQLRNNLCINELISKIFLSDLYEGIPRSYHGFADIITFNPPYIPGDLNHYERRTDLPLIGGERGWETASRFLQDSIPFLSVNGMIILLCYEDWSIDDLDPLGNFICSKNPLIKRDLDGERLCVLSFQIAKKNISNME